MTLPSSRQLLLLAAVTAITFTLAACKKKADKPTVASTPATILDVPKPGDPPTTVQNSTGGGSDVEGASIYRHVRRKLPLVNACYARQRKRNPDLRGKLTVELTVKPKGDVKDARVVSRSLNSPPLEGCVVATIKGFHFQPSARRELTLTLPLLFR